VFAELDQDEVLAADEERARLRRIAAAAPPTHTIDGALQRWRDARADDEDLETIWSGGEGLTTMGARR
jgi:hypothetical protein